MPLNGYEKCLVNIKKIFIKLINFAYLIINFHFLPLKTCTLNASFPNTTSGLHDYGTQADNVPHRQGLISNLYFRYNFILKLKFNRLLTHFFMMMIREGLYLLGL